LAAALFGLIVYIAYEVRAERLPFDQATWKASVQDKTGEQNIRKHGVLIRTVVNCNRGRMVLDLIENHLRNGQTKSEILALLGQPRGINMYRDDSNNEKMGKSSFQYTFGFCGDMSPDGDLLEIIFNQNDRLIDTTLIHF